MKAHWKPLAAALVGLVLLLALASITHRSHTVKFTGTWLVNRAYCNGTPKVNITVKDGSGKLIGSASDVASIPNGQFCSWSANVSVSDADMYTFVYNWADGTGAKQAINNVSKADLESKNWAVKVD